MMSGRVSTRRSLLPRTSRAWRANRSPRKSCSVSLCRCTIVPIAPSSTRMRDARSASSCWLRSFAMRFGPAGDQHRERIARFARADADVHVRQAGADEQPLQLVVVEAETAVAELAAHPFFLMPTQVEDEDAAGGSGHAHGLADRVGGVPGVMERLR